jgi:hypothetical protein
MKTVAGLAVACVALLIILNGKPAFTGASRPQRGITNPVVALQMARDVGEVDAVLSDAPSADREAMRIKQYLDFVFIPCYVALYIAMARMFRKESRDSRQDRLPHLATFAAVCGVMAGIADVMENIGILRVVDAPLARTSQAMVDAIRIPSLIKWALTWVAIAIFAWLFLHGAGWLRRSIGALDAVAAALGFIGLFYNAALVWAGIPMLLGLIGLAFLAADSRRLTRFA